MLQFWKKFSNHHHKWKNSTVLSNNTMNHILILHLKENKYNGDCSDCYYEYFAPIIIFPSQKRMKILLFCFILIQFNHIIISKVHYYHVIFVIFLSELFFPIFALVYIYSFKRSLTWQGFFLDQFWCFFICVR